MRRSAATDTRTACVYKGTYHSALVEMIHNPDFEIDELRNILDSISENRTHQVLRLRRFPDDEGNVSTGFCAEFEYATYAQRLAAVGVSLFFTMRRMRDDKIEWGRMETVSHYILLRHIGGHDFYVSDIRRSRSSQAEDSCNRCTAAMMHQCECESA